jgi:putative ABC transport system permease protein
MGQTIDRTSAPATPSPQRPPTLFVSQRRGLLLGASWRSAIKSLLTNRTRSLLTMLGVIVGVAAVLTAVTLTAGASALITQRISALGSNLVYISPGSGGAGGGLGGLRVGGEGGGGGVLGNAMGANTTTLSLTQADADAIALQAHVSAVTPILTTSAHAIYQHSSSSTNVEGVYTSEYQIGSWTMADGRWFTASENRGAQPVVILGANVVSDLFTGVAGSPVGRSIFINGQAFRVIGSLQAKGSNQDSVIFTPFMTIQSRLNNSTYVNSIQAQVDGANNVTATQAAITTLLTQRHHIQSGQPADFRINSSNQIAASVQTSISTLTLLLVGIATISLIVGGIGIMNIMLVSVTERTREIGVRVALGARRSDIRNQFLIEAVTLSAVGGVLGIVLGLVAGGIFCALAGLPFSVDYGWTALAFGVSAGIGILFGLYPAARAARLDPIVALRSE